jgi:Na+/melibiose symporter-like transporter
MSDSSDETKTGKPFQFSLRSLFAVTTLLAVWLGLAKWSPEWSVFVLLPIFGASLYWYVKWLLEKKRSLPALGCLFSLLLVAIPVLLFPVIEDIHDKDGVATLESMLCAVIATGVVSLPFAAYALIEIMADRQDQREKAEAARRESDQSSTP